MGAPLEGKGRHYSFLIPHRRLLPHPKVSSFFWHCHLVSAWVAVPSRFSISAGGVHATVVFLSVPIVWWGLFAKYYVECLLCLLSHVLCIIYFSCTCLSMAAASKGVGTGEKG